MGNIYELSDRELFQLKAVDPYLSDNWEDLLFQILPKLDRDNQQIIKEDILEPRGIYYDREQQHFYAREAQTLAEILETTDIRSQELLLLIDYMLEIIAPRKEPVFANELADSIESTLSQLKKIVLDDTDKAQIRYNVLKAFLYDVAKWIDGVELIVDAGMRKMSAQIAKVYFKEVFVRQQIQGWDFRSWDAMDIMHLDDIPDWIKTAVKERKCYLIETAQCWFLIGQAQTAEHNPFSFRRFLHEDDGDGIYPAFISHVAIPIIMLENPNAVKLFQRSIERIYTLDKTISGAVGKFVKEMKQFELNTLRPLLKEPLVHDGSDIENVIATRMFQYEKQLTSAVLIKLPEIIQNFIQTEDDKNYLFYHLSTWIKQMVERIEDFRLQPITRFSISAKMMVLKLTCYQLLLAKMQNTLCDERLTEEQKTHQLTEPLNKLMVKLDDINDEYDEINELQQTVLEFQDIQENGGFFSRLFNRQPDYSMQELQAEMEKLSENLFMFLVRLEKQKRNLMVYPEFEIYQDFNKEFRHYAFANGVMGVNRLPKLLRLPEDRRLFNIKSVQEVVYFDVIRGFDRVVK